MRRKLIAGNWKMNTLYSEARHLAHQLVRKLEPTLRANPMLNTVLCPPSIWLTEVGRIIERSPVELGAQDTHWESSGAFTGAVAASMLHSAGVRHVIVGHSERRRLFGETDDTVNRKVLAAFRNQLRPIICVGETAAQRENGKTNQVVLGQVRAALQGALEAAGGAEEFTKRPPAVAYEPVWAIGSGNPATSDDAAEVAGLIRDTLEFELGQREAGPIPILYGGSVKAGNADDFAACPELDGVLIGGASLSVEDFSSIVEAFGRHVVSKTGPAGETNPKAESPGERPSEVPSN